MKIWYCVLTLPVTMLSNRLLYSATVLCSNSYYIVVASIFLVSTGSCKAISGMASVRSQDTFSAILPSMTCPSNTTQYAHVLICICMARVPGTLVPFYFNRHFSHHMKLCPKLIIVRFSDPPNIIHCQNFLPYDILWCLQCALCLSTRNRVA